MKEESLSAQESADRSTADTTWPGRDRGSAVTNRETDRNSTQEYRKRTQEYRNSNTGIKELNTGI